MRNSSNRSRSTSRTQKRGRNNSTTSNQSYQTVAKNISRDGSSYRARVSVNGIRESRNFSTRREAIEWRNQMINERDRA